MMRRGELERAEQTERKIGLIRQSAMKVRVRQMEMGWRYSCVRTWMTSLGTVPIHSPRHTHSETETMHDKSKAETGINIYTWQHDWAYSRGTCCSTLVLLILLPDPWSHKKLQAPTQSQKSESLAVKGSRFRDMFDHMWCKAKHPQSCSTAPSTSISRMPDCVALCMAAHTQILISQLRSHHPKLVHLLLLWNQIRLFSKGEGSTTGDIMLHCM